MFSIGREVNVCFPTTGEMYHVVYSNIFCSVLPNSFIRKSVDNEDLLKRTNEVHRRTLTTVSIRR
jgi:hypothetical protein